MGNSGSKALDLSDDGKNSTCTCNRPLYINSNSTLVNLNHFRLLRVVGKGAFGKVRIVERKDSGLTFALKYIRKDEGNTPPTSDGITTDADSGTIRKCAQYNTGATDDGAS